MLIWLQTPEMLSEYPDGHEVQKVEVVQVMQGNAQLVQVLFAVLRLAPAKQAVQLLGWFITQYMQLELQGAQTPSLALLELAVMR